MILAIMPGTYKLVGETYSKGYLMATTSFDKTFMVSDPSAIKKIRQDLANPRLIKVRGRDYKAENAKGVQLLRQRLSNSAI